MPGIWLLSPQAGTDELDHSTIMVYLWLFDVLNAFIVHREGDYLFGQALCFLLIEIIKTDCPILCSLDLGNSGDVSEFWSFQGAISQIPEVRYYLPSS